MKLFYKRFYCNNTSHCSNAYNDYIYNKKYYKKNEGICRKCGKPLIEGEAKWNFFPIFSVIALVLIIGISAPYIYNKINPKPLAGFLFERPFSTVTEQETAITVTVLRQNNLNKKVFVRYRTESGTAKGGEDFNVENGQIIFQPGEKKQGIVIPIISDLDFLEGREVFNIQLVNVEGLPKHKVIIQNSSRDESGFEEADAFVGQISVIAMDIAEYTVEKETLKSIINSESISSNPDLFIMRRYKKTYNDIDSSLVSARDRYIQLIIKLKKTNHSIVFRSINDKIDSLKRQGYYQQQRATIVMKEHLLSFIKTNELEMKIWTEYLSSAIPKPKIDRPSPNLELMIHHRFAPPKSPAYLGLKT